MLKTRLVFIVFILINIQNGFSQSVEILGNVASNANVENIHVINKTSQRFTITDNNGRFTIPVKLNDTLKFSSVQHKLKEVIISNDIILAKAVFIKLEEQINELDEVLIGKVLTGDLFSDINNIEGDAPINFYDVGIPGYTGKPATQSERRLYEAISGGGIIPLNPIINAITGRTKRLKNHIWLEEKDSLLRQIKSRLIEDFFIRYPLDNTLREDFFYFCQEDINFNNRCKGKSDIEILEYLQERIVLYKTNLQNNKK